MLASTTSSWSIQALPSPIFTSSVSTTSPTLRTSKQKGVQIDVTAHTCRTILRHFSTTPISQCKLHLDCFHTVLIRLAPHSSTSSSSTSHPFFAYSALVTVQRQARHHSFRLFLCLLFVPAHLLAILFFPLSRIVQVFFQFFHFIFIPIFFLFSLFFHSLHFASSRCDERGLDRRHILPFHFSFLFYLPSLLFALARSIAKDRHRTHAHYY
mmetsp:Transcript_9201/g.24943  ORF Transcript_9201/g.24943 Transcript_9201/m.24943 type:complete len:211 (-) Transcript_9201:128-760(-)